MLIKQSKSVKKAVRGLIIGVVLLLSVILLASPSEKHSKITADWTTKLENLFYDTYFKWASKDNAEYDENTKVQSSEGHADNIIIVDIDENSLTKLGNYNEWTRDIHANVIKSLEKGGASAIVFDILFKSADFGKNKATHTVNILKELYPTMDWKEQYPLLLKKYNDDSLLINAVKENGNTIVASMFNSRKAYKHESQWQPLSSPEWQAALGTQSTFSLLQADSAQKIEAKDLLDNIFPELSLSAARIGVVNAFPDKDGIVRKVSMLYRFPNPDIYPHADSRLYGSLSLQTILHLFHQKPENVQIKMGQYINIGKPFGIYRDTSGALQTTYPQFSYPMFKALLASKFLYANHFQDSTKSFIEIAHKIIAKKEDSGEFSFEIFDGQFITGPLAKAVRTLEWNKFKVEPPFVIQKAEIPNQIILVDTNADEEVTLNRYTVETIQYFKNEIDSLKKGEQKNLSCDLDIHFDAKKKVWVSNFNILSPDVLNDILSARPEDFDALPIGEEIRFGTERKIPIDEHGGFQIRYQSRFNIPPNVRTFQHLSYYDVAKNRLDPGLYQGKIFILGSATPALFDFITAPHEENFPAILVHANIIQNILNNEYLINLNEIKQLQILLLLTILSILMGLYMPQRISVISILALSVGYVLIGYYYFETGLYIGIARPIIIIFSVFISAFLVRFYYESKEKRFLNNAFKQYISPELIDEMLVHEIMPTLGGEESYITAFFTDIAGFSSFSEKIGNPQKLVELLNEYLTEMTHILTSNKGTLDKYEGDAIVAFFGAPMPLPNHRQSACETAIAMQRALQSLRKKWASEKGKWPESVCNMHMRIGINTGNIVTGNMGSTMRKNYTMMGDAVNLAARLESIAKQYGVCIHVSEETVQGIVPGTILYRTLDTIRVVGKKKPVATYELLCSKDCPLKETIEKLIPLWEKARQHYLAMEWDKAIELFSQTIELEPHNPDKDPGSTTTPSHVYLSRCAFYKKSPPVTEGETWDGVYTAKEK